MSLEFVDDVLGLKKETVPVITTLENVFDSVGLMRGPTAPLLRAAASFAFVAMVQAAIRPRVMYTDDGSARPWAYASGSQDATALPWWLLPAGAAVFCSVFV